MRQKQLEWFEGLKQEYDIENLCVLSHFQAMRDIITSSRHPIYEYGIYNTIHQRRSAVYINMERFFFDEKEISNNYARNNLFQVGDLPRITKQNVYFSQEELITLEPHILELIVKQVWELLWDSRLIQRMTRAFGKTAGE